MENCTPVPNVVFDFLLRELKLAELKILLVVIRQTLGWQDKKNSNGRKQRDWISSSQLREKTGCSERAITSAIESLVQKNLISVFDPQGSLLDSPQKRRGKTKLFYGLTSANFSVVEKEGIASGEPCKTRNSSVKFAVDFRKICAQLPQKLRITKETLTKETPTKYY